MQEKLLTYAVKPGLKAIYAMWPGNISGKLYSSCSLHDGAPVNKKLKKWA